MFTAEKLLMVMKKFVFLLLFFYGVIPGYAQITGLNLKVESRKELKKVPSASGLVLLDNAFYVVGDNSPWLFKLSKGFKIKEKYLIFPAGQKFDIMPKAMKPDFEALAHYQKEGEDYLLVFGSGSKTPQRDVLVRMKLGKETEAEVFSMREFYDVMRNVAGLKEDALNIEGAVITGGMLFLLERENNLVFVFKWKEMEQYLKDFKTCPVPEVYRMNLPEIEGLEAGFSGAAASADGNKIIFTASVENRKDTYKDGEILGSFVGFFDLLNLENGVAPVCVPIADKEGVLKIKAESVVMVSEQKNTMDLIVVTDSDGGASEVLRLSAGFLFRK